MKLSLYLLIPAVLAATACGSTAALSSGQRFNDGIYYAGSQVSRQEKQTADTESGDKEVNDLVSRTKSSEIYLFSDEKADTVVIPQNKTATINFDNANISSITITDDPFDNAWYSNYYVLPAATAWTFAWSSLWWDPWYYRPHYHHYWHDHWYRPRPGLSSDGSYFYGPRFMTQGGGSMVSRPGSSGTRNYTRSYSSSGGNYGSAGATGIRRGTSAGGGNTSAVSRWNAGRGSSSGSVSRPSGTTNSTVNSGRRPNSNYNYSRSWSNSGSGSGTSTRSNSYTSPSRGNSSRSYTSPSRSYSGGSSFSSPSRSYGGGSGGGVRSGGGGSYSRGRR